jgi:hypothetical protein
VCKSPGTDGGFYLGFDFWRRTAAVLDVQSGYWWKAAAGLGLASCFVLEDFGVIAEVKLELALESAINRL